MAFDESLAARIRKRLRARAGLTEKQMFGGLAFLVSGNMCCGVRGRDMLVRLDPADTDRALRDRHVSRVRPGRSLHEGMDSRGAGLKSAAALAKWVRAGLDYAGSLPPKPTVAGTRANA